MKELAKKINADKSFRSEAYLYMKRQFDKETAKPLCKRDFEKIEQLTVDMSELFDDNDSLDGISKLYSRIDKLRIQKSKKIRIVKRLIPVACCGIIMLAANFISVTAWDMNIVSAVIKFTKGGFPIDFGESEKNKIVLPTTEDDPYGIIAECAKYNIYFETPQYIPDGFILTDVDINVNKDHANTVRFIYWKDNQNFSIDYTRYWNEVDRIGIPSDHYNISETEVNGSPAIVSKEDNQYTITYQKDKTVFFMFAQDVPYDECEKIVESIK